MIVLETNDPEPLNEKTAVVLGTFDGVHLGHREIIQKTVSYARDNNLKSVVITTRQHPRLIIQGKSPPLLTDLKSKLELFEELGLDYVLLLDFNEGLKEMSPEEYLQVYIVDICKAEYIACGFNYHFGKNREGGPDYLEEWSEKNSVKLYLADPVRAKNPDEVVSSSRIREYLGEGNVQNANLLLGYEFFLRGKVVKGDGRGRELGFPTANVEPLEAAIDIPAKGVYEAKVELLDDKADGQALTHKAVVNIGTRPSFTESNDVLLEAHILNFDEDIYGQELKLSFSRKLRDEQKFESRNDLIRQIESDIAAVS